MNKTQALVRNLVYILLTVLLSAGVIMGAGADPVKSFGVFFYGIFGNLNGFGEIFVKATPLILAGLGISVGMQSGFFNIGAEGQMYMGAVGAAVVALVPLPLPTFARLLLSVIAAGVLGGIWSLVPGLLKSQFGISEIINTLMLNYIAFDLVGILIRGALQDKSDFLPQSEKLALVLPLILKPTRLHLGFVLALVLVVLVWWLLQKTSLGYEMKVVGHNPRAAQCTGISVMKSVVAAAFLSGALGGIAGASELLGVQHRLLEGIAAGNGYTAILVALLGKNNPFGVCAAAIGFAALQVGASTMQRQMGIPSSIVSIITGFIVLLILSSSLFDELLQKFRRKAVAS